MKLMEISPMDSYGKIVATINADCGKYIQSLGGWKKWLAENKKYRGEHNLFRGIKGATEPGMRNVRERRTPKDTPGEIHEMIDHYFDNKFGHPYRSNAMFATSDSGEANVYGDLNAVFPIGNYETLWSPEIKDLWGILEDDASEDDIDTHDFEEMEAVVQRVLNRAGYTENAPMEEIIESAHEVMVACRAYYFIPYKEVNTLLDTVERMLETGALK